MKKTVQQSKKPTTSLIGNRVIAGLEVFPAMPFNPKPGKPHSDFYCSWCRWLIMPEDRFKRKQFAPDIWLCVHSDCSENEKFKGSLEKFEAEIGFKK